MQVYRRFLARSFALTAVLLFLTFGVVADEGVSGDAKADEAKPADTSSETADGTDPSSKDVLKEMKKQRRERTAIQPEQTPIVEAEPGAGPQRGERLNVDPRVVGIAPGQPQPALRREGEFVPMRRGRLVRSPNGDQVMFVFEADSKNAPEPPMVLMPCQRLEFMERQVAERGDKVVFLASGHVFVYRGANYLLPIEVKLAVNKGNLGE